MTASGLYESEWPPSVCACGWRRRWERVGYAMLVCDNPACPDRPVGRHDDEASRRAMREGTA